MQQLLEDQERTTREAAEVQDEDGAAAEERANRSMCNVADDERTRHPMTWQRGERRRATGGAVETKVASESKGELA